MLGLTLVLKEWVDVVVATPICFAISLFFRFGFRKISKN